MDNVYTVVAYNSHFNLISQDPAAVTCDVTQEVQDWLMREFDPGTLWSYVPNDQLPTGHFGWGRERVLLQPEVYTALVLRWA